MLGVLTAGLVLGGALTATALWLLSGLASAVPETGRLGLVAALALLGALRDADLVRVPLPQNARQIPQDVLQRNLVRGTLQFGFELGTGVRTYVSASAPYAMAVAVLLCGGSPAAALLAGLGFGLGRALTPVMRLTAGDSTAWDRRLGRRERLMAVCACLAVATAFALLALLSADALG
ncbi:hypothetical protein ACTWP5_07765 [Streptomyces sp. 4N509B]|uniref:hypothetical protein n=1 Tax=Streptomyces sp. 4N509B TaxID=3457413 RepID=UPI003FD49F1F